MSVYQPTAGETINLMNGAYNSENHNKLQNYTNTGSLPTQQGTISQFLAPLTQDTLNKLSEKLRKNYKLYIKP
jgi:adenylate cyclase